VSRVGHALGEEGSRLAELVLTANAATQRDLTALKVEMSELRSEVEETKEGMNGAAQTCHATIDAISETRAAAEAANTAHAVLAAKFDAATTAHAALAAKVAAGDSQLEAACDATEAVQSQQWGFKSRLDACEASAASVNATVLAVQQSLVECSVRDRIENRARDASRRSDSVWSGASQLRTPRSPDYSAVTETGANSIPGTPATPWGGERGPPEASAGSPMVPGSNPVFARGKITPDSRSKAAAGEASLEFRIAAVEASWEAWQSDAAVAQAGMSDEASRMAKAP